jgi:sugar-specific transcriptional regulator TrmB
MRESKLVDALQALGFTIYEAKTYLALLRLGAPANGYEAARAAGIPTSKIYETLRRLSEKGAVMVNTSAPITYAPVPHRDLTARLRDRSEATLATVETGLAAIPAGGEPSLTWTVAGADNVVARMRQLVLAVLTAPLTQAHARGVELQVAIYGTQRLEVPFTYDLALCGASAQERLGGRRLAVLIRDGAEAIAAETHPAGAEAIWSQNRVFALLCTEYAKSDIMGRCLIDALGELAYQRLRRERPELRTMLRPEPPPAGGPTARPPRRTVARQRKNRAP